MGCVTFGIFFSQTHLVTLSVGHTQAVQRWLGNDLIVASSSTKVEFSANVQDCVRKKQLVPMT
jgi:hypothetical protein